MKQTVTYPGPSPVVALEGLGTFYRGEPTLCELSERQVVSLRRKGWLVVGANTPPGIELAHAKAQSSAGETSVSSPTQTTSARSRKGKE